MKIDKTRFYSLLEAQKFTGIKSRQYLAKYIREEKLMAIITGNPGPRQRYAIRGDWLESFIDRYKRGVIRNEKYINGELNLYIKRVIDFCALNGITKISELKQYEEDNKTARNS